MKRTIIAATVAAAIVLSPQAHADEIVTICPDGRSGVAQGQTSCEFAHNVRNAYFASRQNPAVVSAYSPVTGEVYSMYCAGGSWIQLNDGTRLISARCTGGNGAVVWGW